MALGLTQPLAEMSTRNISWVSRRPVRRADNLTTSICLIVLKSGRLTLLEPSGPVQACNGIALPFTPCISFLSHASRCPTHLILFNLFVVMESCKLQKFWLHIYSSLLLLSRRVPFIISDKKFRCNTKEQSNYQNKTIHYENGWLLLCDATWLGR